MSNSNNSAANGAIRPARPVVKLNTAPSAKKGPQKRFKAPGSLSRGLSRFQAALDTPAEEAARKVQARTEKVLKPLFRGTQRIVTNGLAASFGALKGTVNSSGEFIPVEIMSPTHDSDVKFGAPVRAGSLHEWDEDRDRLVLVGDDRGPFAGERTAIPSKNFTNGKVRLKGKAVDAVVTFVLDEDEAPVMAIYMVNEDSDRYGEVYVAYPLEGDEA